MFTGVFSLIDRSRTDESNKSRDTFDDVWSSQVNNLEEFALAVDREDDTGVVVNDSLVRGWSTGLSMCPRSFDWPRLKLGWFSNLRCTSRFSETSLAGCRLVVQANPRVEKSRRRRKEIVEDGWIVTMTDVNEEMTNFFFVISRSRKQRHRCTCLVGIVFTRAMSLFRSTESFEHRDTRVSFFHKSVNWLSTLFRKMILTFTLTINSPSARERVDKLVSNSPDPYWVTEHGIQGETVICPSLLIPESMDRSLRGRWPRCPIAQYLRVDLFQSLWDAWRWRTVAEDSDWSECSAFVRRGFLCLSRNWIVLWRYPWTQGTWLHMFSPSESRTHYQLGSSADGRSTWPIRRTRRYAEVSSLSWTAMWRFRWKSPTNGIPIHNPWRSCSLLRHLSKARRERGSSRKKEWVLTSFRLNSAAVASKNRINWSCCSPINFCNSPSFSGNAFCTLTPIRP